MPAPEQPDAQTWLPELDIALAVMGNRTKSSIVRHLWQNGPSYGTQISTGLGISTPRLSQAMRQLEAWRIVIGSIPTEKRHGRPVLYTLNRERIRSLTRLWTDFVEGRPVQTDEPDES